MTHEPTDEDGRAERFEYFMLRLTRSVLEPDRVTGLIEQIGSGEKRSFDTGEQLLQLVGGLFTPARPGTLQNATPDARVVTAQLDRVPRRQPSSDERRR